MLRLAAVALGAALLFGVLGKEGHKPQEGIFRIYAGSRAGG
jgi:hypothetical protein